jgi:hypothetical protein
MSLETRPYIGSWKMGQKKLIQYAPDCLVYINGDVTLPGCPRCNSRINFQQFVTDVSVDAGTDAGASSATFSLSIPVHHLDSFARDARYILRPGLEVHIYERGYFPVSGLYSNLDDPTIDANIKTSDSFPVGEAVAPTFEESFEISAQEPETVRSPNADGNYLQKVLGQEKASGYGPYRKQLDSLWAAEKGNLKASYSTERMRYITLKAAEAAGVDPAWIWGQVLGESSATPVGPHVGPTQSDAFGVTQIMGNRFNEEVSKGTGDIWWAHADLVDPKLAIWTTAYSYQRMAKGKKGASDLEAAAWWTGGGTESGTSAEARARLIGRARTDLKRSAVGQPGDDYPPVSSAQASALATIQNPTQPMIFTPEEGMTLTSSSNVAALGDTLEGPPEPSLKISPSALDQLGLSGYDIEDILAYPYYPTFHGVVTSVNFQYSGGTQHATINCSSMLHFWQYHRMSTNGSFLGLRPFNSGNRMSLLGHNFTGMHPYEIIYALHYDTVGAANGVAWALSQKTNQDARSGQNGEDLYSLTAKYWERRFNTRETKLRLHGATGELFNAAQAAFLSTLSSDEFTLLLRERFGTEKSQVPAILSQAVSLGLFRKRKLDSLLYLKENGAEQTGDFDISVPEMQAFASNVQQIGNVQLFESTYESKLDIAQKVCEVTGFEFYQDVDGDFVFKPPMYNLDTSSSRVYRIEDIDIISISFDEQEPQATYITGKGSFIENVQGTGIENEWGVQGQYIDYRLVAQYGWRPADFETSYLTDPKAVYYAAVNRLDILNAPSRKATVNIPGRPEIRPGYPVYIPYLDCYYYCPGFSHSFSVGGQCTTTLQLIARRAKFYAPGEVGKSGIEAIHLNYTALPEHPLEVLDEAGRPRLAGFPNVVMALDPTQINPAFLVAGNDIENLNTPEALQSLLSMAVMFGVLKNIPDASGQPSTTYTMAADSQRDITFYLDAKPEGATNAFSLPVLAEKYSQKLGALGTSRNATQAKITELSQQLGQALSVRLQLDKVKDEAQIKAESAIILDLQNQIQKLGAQVTQEEAAFESALTADTSDGLSFLMQLIRRTGAGFYKTRQPGSNVGDPNSTAVILDLLSNKKAIFTNGAIPGSYRYYSASHPNPDQQGMLSLTINTTGSGPKLHYEDSLLEGLYKDQEVDGFTLTPQMYYGSNPPEAQLVKMKPTRGIRVYTSNPDFPNGEILPTSEIKEMSFIPIKTKLKSKKADTKPIVQVSDLGAAFQNAFEQSALAKVGNPSNTSTISEAMRPWMAQASANVQQAAGVAKEVLDSANQTKVPTFSSLTDPTSVKIKDFSFSVTVPIGTTYKFSGSSGIQASFANAQNCRIPSFWKFVSVSYADAVLQQILKSRDLWLARARGNGLKQPQLNKVQSAFNEAISATYTSSGKRGVKEKEAVEAAVLGETSTVVFPVSDAQGYEVVGSLRYGRDVDIDPDGAIDTLHNQDPLSMLDRKTVEDVVKAVIKKEVIYVDQEVPGSNPVRYRRMPLAGAEANTYLEKKMLSSLREHMSDSQIISLDLAKPGKDPNVLEINLSNWFSDKGKEGIHKLPLINAGYSLGDLASTMNKSVCNCKAAEAGILLDVAGQQNFVQFIQPGAATPRVESPNNLDQTTQWLISSAAQASLSWKVSQDAMRGSMPDQQGSFLVPAFQGASDSFAELSRQLEERKRTLLLQVDNLGETE